MLKSCHRHRLLSALAFAIMLPTLGIVAESSFEALEKYNFRTAPIEKFYSIDSVVAHDVDLSESDVARIEIHRNAQDNYTSTRYRTLVKIGLQPIRPDTQDPAVPSYDVIIDTQNNDIFLEQGEKVIVIEESMIKLMDGKEVQEGEYYWIIQYEIHFPYGIERTTSAYSNQFSVIR